MAFPQFVIDFETASAVDLKKCGAWVYSEDPTTEVLCLAWWTSLRPDGATALWVPGDPLPPELAAAIEKGAFFIAHNAGFEKAIWRNIMVPVYGWPDIPNHWWHDTLAVCAEKSLPLDLDHAAITLRLPYQKDNEGSNFTKSLSKPNKRGEYDRSEKALQRVYDYCRQDIATQVALHQRVGWQERGERRVWLLDQKINERGLRIDLPFVRACRGVVDRASVPLLAEFRSLTGGLKPTQVQKFGAWVKDRGVSIPNMAKETLAQLLGADEDGEDVEDFDASALVQDVPDDVRRALSIRQLIGSASVKKLPRMEMCAGADGRVRGTMQYHAATTGRWGGRLFQPHNFPRGTTMIDQAKPDAQALVDAIMTGDPDYVEMLFGPAVETVVSSLRHAIIADPGKQFISGDFAGIEARVVLALAGQHDKTELMASGADVYCHMASRIFGRPIDKKKDPEERQTGKNSVLGLGFQMGWRKFKARYAKDKPDDFAQRVVETYRNEWAPLVPKLWFALEGAAVRTVHERNPHEAYGVFFQLEDLWLTARLPSGRKLWYFNPQATRKAMPWDETDIRLAWTYQTKKLGKWVTVDAYGGLITENVVQALARDILVDAMFKCEQENLPVVLTVHDEILIESDRGDEKMLTQIMENKAPWVHEMQVPIAVETWSGERYKK